MKALLLLALLFTAVSTLAAPVEKTPKWSLMVSQNGDDKGKKTYSVPPGRQVIPMGENNWTCSTVPDPKDGFKMGIVCTFEKQSVSMPVICHEKMPKVSTLTVGNEKFFTALALLCEPHRGRKTPLKR